MIKIKTEKELLNLSTRNLLSYYRAERQRFNCAMSVWLYGFDRVDYMWDYSEEYELEKIQYTEWRNYLNSIKTILNSREHIAKKNCFL